MRDRKSVFEDIYRKKEWGKKGTLSGEGTLPQAATAYVSYLSQFLKNNKEIYTILDLGHGDWAMWPLGFFKQYNYTGVEVARSVVEKCQKNFESASCKFIEGDFLNIELSKADLVLVKDVLIHFSDEDIRRTLNLISNSKYSIVVTDIESRGLRVFVGKLKREFLRRKRLGVRVSLKRVLSKKYLDEPIETGSYHWVNLLDPKWNLPSYNLRVLDSLDYINRGLTFGRTTTKRIVLLTSINSS